MAPSTVNWQMCSVHLPLKCHKLLLASVRCVRYVPECSLFFSSYTFLSPRPFFFHSSFLFSFFLYFVFYFLIFFPSFKFFFPSFTHLSVSFSLSNSHQGHQFTAGNAQHTYEAFVKCVRCDQEYNQLVVCFIYPSVNCPEILRNLCQTCKILPRVQSTSYEFDLSSPQDPATPPTRGLPARSRRPESLAGNL